MRWNTVRHGKIKEYLGNGCPIKIKDWMNEFKFWG
jgi:hypothetical protein